MRTNNGVGAAYVKPWAERLQTTVTEEDQDTIEVLHILARQFGYKNYKDMVKRRVKKT